jgi:hypothetical protein
MTNWGWMNTAPNGDGNVHWIPGTLEDSYARVSGANLTLKSQPYQRWILVSANPISEYHRVLDETRKANRQ